jgi:hypothetical protein
VWNKQEANFGNAFMWSGIDPKKVKQRIQMITNQIEAVLLKFESQVDDTSNNRK